MIGYFITGTDTGVGKTYVTCTLARRARLRGQKVFAFKPIESGCERRADGTYVGADQELVVEAAGAWQLGPLRGLYQLPLPAAPLVAAEAAGTAIDLDLITSVASQAIQREQPGLILVEGAGGWRVPITPEADTGTLARSLRLPLVVVARAGLGTINHTLLTVEAIERDGLPVAAVVFSQRREDDPLAALRNRDEVLRRWPGTVLILGEDPAGVDSLLTAPPVHP